MSKKMRFLSFILAIAILISSAPAVPVYAEEEASVSAELTNPFRSDVSFTVDGKSFTSNSYRIPSMVTLADGTIVAAADIRWNTTYDGGGLDTLVARSTDGGKTWSYTTANYLGDNGNEYNGSSSAAFLDPSLVVGADGKTVYMLVDLYPYGVALNGSGHTNPSTDVGFNDQGKLLLSGDNHNSYSYYLDGNKIYTSTGTVVEGYSVDEKFNITGNGIESNLFFKDSPFKVVRTGYLYLTSSTDGGASWSAPTLLNNIKTTSEQVCLIAPGSSITTSDGTMIFPVYSFHGDNKPEGNTQRLSFIYSKDGINWSRTEELDHNWASEAAVVELQDGTLRFFIRNGAKKLCYVDYNMENGWGSVVTLTDINTNSNTQISAITYSRTSNGKQVVLVSCPTGPSRNGSYSSSAAQRLNGSIFVLTVDSNGDTKLESTIHVNENNNQFMYSCLTERSDGSVLILFENKENGWGVGDNCFYTMDIKGYLPSALGIPLDEPQNIIVDEKGNIVDSITLGQYEKPELTANAPFSTADVDYQWQIEYEDGKWVDIYGEDSKTVRLSFGMVATLLGDEGKVDIRCKTTAGTQVVYSKPITVTVEMYQPEEPDVVVTDSFITSSGETVTVSVAGALPEDASVQLGETDSTGVDVKPSETVVAALDISIKNADGTEWQPASGETVTVTLEASKIGLKNGDEFVVYHLHNGEVRVLGSYKVVNDTVSFEVDGFSKFVFTLAEQTVFSDDLQSNIGKTATINDAYDYFSAVADPNVEEWSMAIEGEDYPAGIEFIITDVHVSSTYPYNIYYKVKIKDDEVLNDFLSNYPWIYQGHQDEDASWGTLILHDNTGEPAEPSCGITVDGAAVSEVEVSVEDKVTVTATPTNVDAAVVTYQWQILIPAANMWVNISGQTTADCTINYGMVAGRLDADGKVKIRCVVTADGVEITSEPISVNVLTGASEASLEPAAAEPAAAEPAAAEPAAAESAAAEPVAAEPAAEEPIALFSTRAAANGVMPLAEGDDTGDSSATKYTVSVYYYVGDSTVMHREVYTMQFGVNEEAKTTSFPIPEREGYTAYYFGTNANIGKENGTEYTKAEYTLENFKPTSDMSLYVRYYPNEDTKYTVEHWVQNIYDDGWTLLDTEYLEGVTDTYIPAFNQNYESDTLAWNLEAEGFYATPYKRDTIAASGNTVVKIYYERYMYLLMFDLGEGGMGVDPIYARVGVEYEVTNEPTRRGYVFDGWQLENGATIPKDSKPYVFEIPAKDTTVKALWRASDTTYTVVYWKENADPDKDAKGEIVRDSNGAPVYSYSYWAHAEVESNTGAIVSGTGNIISATDVTQNEAQYFTFNAVATDKNVVVKGNGSTVVNVYYLRNYYEIYFYASGNTNPLTECAVTTHTHGDGTCEAYPICAQKEHEHDDTCTRLGLTCGTTLHTHTDACCTKTVHAEHTSACCTDTVHANHTTSCYNNVGNAYTGNRVNNINPTGDGYIYRYNSSNRYIYINGRWYNYSGTGYTGNIAQTNASCPGIHTHGDGNCTCAKAIHTHDDGTCTCNATEHREHTDACYEWECGTSVSHVHTSACYSACTKPAHTHGSSCRYDSRYLLKIIRAKYDADIYKEWPVANDSIPGLAGFAYWSGNGNNQSSRVVTMNSDWAKSAGVRVSAHYNTTGYQLNYWFEDTDQTDTTTNATRVFKEDLGKYYVLSEEYTQVAYYSSTSSWNYKEITGMTRAYTTSASITTVNGVNTANLYYNRNRSNLYFESDNANVYTENGVLFEKPLGYYLDADGNYITDIIPATNPVDKPASGYYFEGWYTTGECFPGTKVDFTKLTMPNNDLTLFANWAPRTHKIEFYFDSSLSNKLNEDEFPTQLILHNEYGADPGLPGHPMDFEAVVWFYRDANGEEKSFNFAMPVTEDMKLYPKWRTNVYINYEVRYKVYDQNSNSYTDIEIADRLYGEELYGELVTLNPKGTEEFYDAYKQIGNGYFPMSGSHSINMGEETCSGTPPYTFCTWDEQTSTHIFTFYYVNGPTIPYTVEYHAVDSDGNFVKKLLGDKYVPDNYYAKVVENAAIIPGYMPDEAQKTLYVVYEGENKIIFNYTIDENASFYRVSHWVKKYGSDEYVLIQDPDDFASHVGDIISNYPPLTLPGVTYTHTEIDPADHTVGKTIDGEPGLTVDLYYEEESVTINYVVKGPSNCGTLSLYTETVGGYYGTAVGSQATPASAVYKFVGWYSDEACTVPVNYDKTNNKFVPSKVGGVHVAATYYAKFEYNLTSLTIIKNGAEAYKEIDPNQTFIFNIKGDGVDLDVTVHRDANGKWFTTIDGLTVGATYTITEKTNWSWRYEYASVALTNATLVKNVANGAEITLGLDGTITFTNTRNNEQWLDGDSWCNNIFQ